MDNSLYIDIKVKVDLLMLVWAGVFLLTCFLIKAYKERKRMGCSLIIYLIILVIDLLVGGSLILWKCWFGEDEDECSLAIGGTGGSLAIWMVVMLMCPFCMTRWSLCELMQGVKDGIKHKLEQLRPRKNRHILAETELFLPPKPGLKGEKGFRVAFIDENSNGIVLDSLDVSIIPRGRGTVRGSPNIVFTSDFNKGPKDERVKVSDEKVKDKYSEINET